jgi:hypothetical protein
VTTKTHADGSAHKLALAGEQECIMSEAPSNLRQLTCHAMGPGVLEVADEVATALELGRPVVALESTIIAHGDRYRALPWAGLIRVLAGE